MARKTVVVIAPKDERIEKIGIRKILSLHTALSKMIGDGKDVDLWMFTTREDPLAVMVGIGQTVVDMREYMEERFACASAPPICGVLLQVNELQEALEDTIVNDGTGEEEFKKAEAGIKGMMSTFSRRFNPTKEPTVYTAKLVFTNEKAKKFTRVRMVTKSSLDQETAQNAPA